MNNTDRHARAVARTREDIVDAAARAFSRGGYASTTMQDIAHEAGFTAAALYTYFPGKREIFEALLDHLAAELMAVWDTPMSTAGRFSDRLHRIVEAQVTFAARRHKEFAFMLSPATLQADAAQVLGLAQERRQAVEERAAQWFARHAGPTDLGGRGPDQAAAFLGAVLELSVRRWLAAGAPVDLAEVMDDAVSLFLHGASGPRKAAARAKTTTRTRRAS